jgi:hypothetical protein
MPPEAGSRVSLNKRQVLSGLRCLRKLWFEVHEEAAPELQPDAETLVRFAEGRVVGEYARRAMGPGVHLAPGRDIAQEAVVERTREAMARGESPLFEAGFSAARTNVRADIVQRVDDGWSLVEVKGAKWPEKDRDREKKFEVHVPDVAVQQWVALEAGVPLRASHLMYLNPDCVHPNLDDLFVTVEVTTRAEPVVLSLPAAVSTMHGVLGDAEPPDVPVGDQCTDPDECPFHARCHPALPDHHVSELYYAKRHAAKFIADGKETIHDLDEDDAPNPQAKRQVRAVKTGARIVEPGLRAALDALAGPIAHLDFETVQLAVPRWPGCRPLDLVAVQYSVHREGFADNATRAFLAPRGVDPRPALIDGLLEACDGARTVLAYYASFEKQRIEELADCFPKRRDALMDLHGRIVDLLPIVRDHVYDRDFRGSFSLKKVLPALVPDLGYDDLAIRDGGQATAAIYRLLFEDGLDPADEAMLRRDLLAYCERDTLAMVELLRVLRGLA